MPFIRGGIYCSERSTAAMCRFRKWSRDKTHGFLTQKSCISPFCLILGVVSTELTLSRVFNIGELYYRCYGCSLCGNAINKSLVYSGTKALSQPSTSRGNSQGQETCIVASKKLTSSSPLAGT